MGEASIAPAKAWLNAEVERVAGAQHCHAHMSDHLIISPAEQSPFTLSGLGADEKVVKHPNTGHRYFAKVISCDSQPWLIAVDAEDNKALHERHVLLLTMDIIVILVLMVTAYAVGRFVVDGTNKISSTASEIVKTGDLTQRIEVDGHWDDLSNSAVVINELLARIQELMLGVKRVSDSIAHDLRTPLTRLRNRLEGMAKDADIDELYEVVNEVDRVIRTFNSLLRISRIETERRRDYFECLDLQQLIDDVANFYVPLMEDQDIHLEQHLQPVQIVGDRDLLFQAFANIFDNAIKFTPEGGEIRVNLRRGERFCTVSISDTGPGIPQEHIDKVLQRFYRADPSRNPEGTGLGLSLVNAVVSLHHGSINLSNDNLGLSVSLRFPIQAINQKQNPV